MSDEQTRQAAATTTDAKEGCTICGGSGFVTQLDRIAECDCIAYPEESVQMSDEQTSTDASETGR